jgi:hypothetical protein
VVINNLNSMGTGIAPVEADTPLVIDPNAVLTGSLAFEQFQPVSWWNAQVLKRGCDSKLQQLATSPLLDGFEPLDANTVGEGLGVRTAEREDHASMLTHIDSIVSR